MSSYALQKTFKDIRDSCAQPSYMLFNYICLHIGHGGSEAAKFAKENLLQNIQNEPQFQSNDNNDIMNAIRNGFATTQNAMWGQRGKLLRSNPL